MKTTPTTLLCLVAIGTALRSGGESTTFAASVLSENKVPGRVESTVRRLSHDLKKAGFEVARGYFKAVTREDCPSSFQVMGSCFLNNPAAPYIVPVVPLWPEEFADPATRGAFGPTAAGYSVTYRIDSREAILIAGQLPPAAKYFGLQSYLITRQGEYDATSAMYSRMQAIEPRMLAAFFHTIPANADRIITFDSLSNSLNDVIIAEQSGAAFNQLRYFLITPDRTMDEAVRAALDNVAVDEKDIFTEQIPSNKQFGLEESADEFLTLIRYAMPDVESDAQTWRHRLPLVVLRIRPHRPDWQPLPYDEFTEGDIDARQANDEFWLKPHLDALVQAVFAHWGQAYDPARVRQQLDFQSVFEMVGPRCERIGMDCLGDNQDASYQAHPLGFTLDFGEVYAYVGVLGTKTGNATYVGLGLNNGALKLGLHNIDGELLEGTAAAYAHGQYGHLSATIDNFFVYYFTRDCNGLTLTGGNCYSIPTGELPLCTDPTGQTCVRGIFTERDYMVPGTRRGPDSRFVLPGRYIKLSDPR